MPDYEIPDGYVLGRREALDVLDRVSRSQPLFKGDYAAVVELINRGHLHVNPERNTYPYCLTDAGRRALQGAR